MSLPVFTTQRFERAVQLQFAHYRRWQARFPSSGQAFVKVLRALNDEAIPLLSLQPELGRRMDHGSAAFDADQALLSRLMPLEALLNAEPREWRIGDFLLLYYTTPKAIYLASLRHARQQQFV
jgi:hypothetical protein